MTTVNLSQQQYRDARRQFGRSMIVQLLIFMAIELGVEVLFYVINLFQNFLFNVVSNRYSFEIGMQFSSISSFVFNCFTFIILVGVLFLHRSVTFRSADSIMHNALPLTGLYVLGGIVVYISSSLIVRIGAPFYTLYSRDNAGLLFVVFSLVSTLTGALVVFAKAGTVRLACKKNILFLLPLLGFIPASYLDVLISYCIHDSVSILTYHNFSIFSILLDVIQALLSWLVGGLAAFFALRMLVYRDTYDTTPGAQRNIIRRYLMAYPLALHQTPPAAPEAQPEPAPIAAEPVPAEPDAFPFDAQKEE